MDTALSATPFQVGSLIKPQQTLFNYTSNWEFKVISDILYDRLPISVFFGVLYAQLCPSWVADCCVLVSLVECSCVLLWLQVCSGYYTLNEKLCCRTAWSKWGKYFWLSSLYHGDRTRLTFKWRLCVHFSPQSSLTVLNDLLSSLHNLYIQFLKLSISVSCFSRISAQQPSSPPGGIHPCFVCTDR